jgi:hypothetical protein
MERTQLATTLPGRTRLEIPRRPPAVDATIERRP